MKKLLALFVLAGCGGASPQTASMSSPSGTQAAEATPAPSSVPTAFGVEVAGKGRPVILIPGLGCPGSVWADTVAHLGPGVETHVLTLSGFAGRPAIDKPVIATARAELAAYIRDRHLDHPVIIGHSLGGFLAYWLGATEPDLVGPLVAVDSLVFIGAMPGAADGAATMRDTWKKATPQEFAAGTRQFFTTMTNDAGKLEPVLAQIERSDQRAMADAFYELFTTDIRPELPKIKAPVLAIIADSPYQKFIGEQLAPVAHHEVALIPHTRHMVMYDDAEGFNRALDGFLAAHPR